MASTDGRPVHLGNVLGWTKPGQAVVRPSDDFYLFTKRWHTRNLPDEKATWDRKYREGSHAVREPDPFLLKAHREFVGPLFPAPGRALDVAGGAGRHALWLAARGWDVTLVDISGAGVAKARERAKKRQRGQGKIHFVVSDLNSYKFPRRRFDLVVVFFYLERRLFPALSAALKPGGLLIYKTYTREHCKFRECSHPMYFLEPGELRCAFPGFEVLYSRETVKEKGMAELVARKP